MIGAGTFAHWPEIPAIGNEHLFDARLYANRNSMICDLPIRRNGKIAEIGVWQGNFSKVLVSELRPQKFYAFDIFTGHLETEWNGLTGEQLFEGMTHRQFYEKEMSKFGSAVTVVEGSTETTLHDFMDRSFDLVYVDAAHNYESVKNDAVLAQNMVSVSGLLVFNDYVLLDPSNATPYGVVPVVNDLVVNHGWRVVGFALQAQMYCDIALRR